MPVQRGDVFFAPFGQSKPRPVVIVSRDDHNNGDYVVVVPFTTQRLDQRRRLASCVFFKAGDCGLTQDCVAKTDEITFIPIRELDWRRKRAGRVVGSKMKEIVRAIRYMIRDDDLDVASPPSVPT